MTITKRIVIFLYIRKSKIFETACYSFCQDLMALFVWMQAVCEVIVLYEFIGRIKTVYRVCINNRYIKILALLLDGVDIMIQGVTGVVFLLVNA